jgi:hypothetical protein
MLMLQGCHSGKVGTSSVSIAAGGFNMIGMDFLSFLILLVISVAVSAILHMACSTT